jgi:hypothetical protein
MTRPADIPAETQVRRVLNAYLAECHDNGKRPSVLTLASRLGLSNTTFRRHFPQQAKEISEARSRPEHPYEADTQPSPYDVLAARNARLRRANRTLTGSLKLAAAQIQRLGTENALLREALEASSNIAHIDRPGRSHRR